MDVLITGDTVVEPDETFLVNLSAASGATLADGQGLGTIQNDDTPTINTTTTVSTSPNPSQVGQSVLFSATVAPASGTIKPSGTVTFRDGATTIGTLALSTNGTASFSTSLLAAGTHPITAVYTGNATFNSSTSAVLNQVVNAAPTLSVSDRTLVEGNAGQTNAVFTVSLSKTPALPVTVVFSTANISGGVTAGFDYTATTSTLTFAANTSVLSQTVSVPILGDTTREGDETFAVNLSNPSGATLADAQGVGTIQNDDFVADLSITQSASASSVPRGGEVVFTLSVRNNGPDASQNVVVVNTLPSGTTFVSSTPTATSLNPPTFALGTLASGATQTIALRVRAGQTLGSLTNSARVSGSGAVDATTSNNTSSAQTTVVSGPANVTAQVGATLGPVVNSGPYSPTLYHPGAQLTQSVTLKNNGTTPLAGPLVLVLDGLPSSVTLSNASGRTQTTSPAASAFIVVSVGTDNFLSPGESVSVRLDFTLSGNVGPTFTPRVLAGPGTP